MSCPNGYSRHQSDIERWCLWEHYVKTDMKNFTTSPRYHVVITYACLGACSYWLTPIFCSVGVSFLWINFEIFIQIQVALCFTQIIWWTFSYDAPSYFWKKVVYFNFSVFLRQFCVICVILMGKGCGCGL